MFIVISLPGKQKASVLLQFTLHFSFIQDLNAPDSSKNQLHLAHLLFLKKRAFLFHLDALIRNCSPWIYRESTENPTQSSHKCFSFPCFSHHPRPILPMICEALFPLLLLLSPPPFVMLLYVLPKGDSSLLPPFPPYWIWELSALHYCNLKSGHIHRTPILPREVSWPLLLSRNLGIFLFFSTVGKQRGSPHLSSTVQSFLLP